MYVSPLLHKGQGYLQTLNITPMHAEGQRPAKWPDVNGLRAARVRGLPALWATGTRFDVQDVPSRHKWQGICSSCGAGSECGAVGRRGVATRTLKAKGNERAVRIAFKLASQPTDIETVLGIVYRARATHLIRKTGLTHVKGQTGTVPFIQRFGSGLKSSTSTSTRCVWMAFWLKGERAPCVLSDCF